MRLIHCADLHLDSKMSANLDKEQAKIRRGELLNTYLKMVDFAVKAGAEAILITGDMFDTSNISATCRNAVVRSIEEHPDMGFYYLKGNHDSDNFLSSLGSIPDNLYLFDKEWTSYRIDNIVISGAESCARAASLKLKADDFNIVMLHGQEDDSSALSRAKDNAEIINLRDYKNLGIDYLALGHVHQYKLAKLDARGFYCYPGCLEGRGFDECGEHGFVVIDIDEDTGRYKHRFVPFASRLLYEIEVGVGGCMSTFDIAKRIQNAVNEQGCSAESLIKIILTGDMDVECEKNIDALMAMLKDQFFCVKVKDDTTLKIDFENFFTDESLRGEFVRLVMNDSSISAEDKNSIIRYGLMALAGEEVM